MGVWSCLFSAHNSFCFTLNILFETSRDSRRKTCLHECSCICWLIGQIQCQGHLKPPWDKKKVTLNKCVRVFPPQGWCWFHNTEILWKTNGNLEFSKIGTTLAWISSNPTELRFDLKPHGRVKLKIATEVWVFHSEPISFWEQVCWSLHVLTDCRAAVAVWSGVYPFWIKMSSGENKTGCSSLWIQQFWLCKQFLLTHILRK